MTRFRRAVLFMLCLMIVWCMSIPNYTALAAEEEVIWLDEGYEQPIYNPGGYWSYRDTDDRLVMFSEGLAIVITGKDSDRKYGFVDEKGNVVIPPKYDFAYRFEDGLALVELDGKYGFIDKNGKEVIPLKYDYAYPFSEGLACVQVGKQWGYIDKEDNMVIPPKYGAVSSFSEGLAAVSKHRNYGKWDYIDKSGNVVLSVQYSSAGSFKDGVAVVYNSEFFHYGNSIFGYEIQKYGLIDKTGKEILPLEYDNIEPFYEGLAKIEINDKYGFVDTKGNIVIPPKYDYAASFKEGMAPVMQNNKYGFVDKNGNEVVPLKYDYVCPFSEGLAAVTLGYKSGFIDKTGKVVIPIKYESVNSFSEGLATAMFHIGVYEGYRFGYIDRKGNIVIPPKYSSDYSFKDGVTLVQTSMDEGNRTGILKNPIAPKIKKLREFVTRLYELTLNRKPDQQDLNYWVFELYDGKKTGANVSESFIFSKEFMKKDISDSDFINIMYRAFFNREPDEAGRAHWLNKLEEGYSRRYVLASFVNSKEFKEICNAYGITPGSIKLAPEDTKPNS